jgi:urease beta subunit
VLGRDALEVDREPQFGDAAVQGAVDDLQFEPGRRPAEALVHALLGREVVVGLAGDVDPVRKVTGAA